MQRLRASRRLSLTRFSEFGCSSLRLTRVSQTGSLSSVSSPRRLSSASSSRLASYMNAACSVPRSSVLTDSVLRTPLRLGSGSPVLGHASFRQRSVNALRHFTTDFSKAAKPVTATATKADTVSSAQSAPKKTKKKKKVMAEGTSKSYMHKTTQRVHVSADGKVKSSKQSAIRLDRVVSDGDTEINVSKEFRDIEVQESVPQSKDERATVTRKMSKSNERMSIRSSDEDVKDESKENETSTFSEHKSTETVDGNGRVISSKDGTGTGGVDDPSNRTRDSKAPPLSGTGLHPDLEHTYDRTQFTCGTTPPYELRHPIADPFKVGNPTEEEIARRRELGTCHALIIHPDRLLPAVLKLTKKKKTWTQSIVDSYYSFARTIKKRIIGEERWDDLREKVESRYGQAAEDWDTTQNPHVVALRSLVDKMNVQTETSRAMEILQEEMDDFWVEDFLPEFSEHILPIVVKAYFNEDLDYLQLVCSGEAKVFVTNTIQARQQANMLVSNDILWINEADLIETKLSKDRKPQIIVRAEVQTVDCVYDRKTNDVIQGAPSLVANNVFVMTLEANLEETHLNSVGYPWQIRQIQTAKVKQLI